MSFKIDLHVHTHYSEDCATKLEDVITYARKKGLDGVAIADHDTVEGALELLKDNRTGLMIIPGIEVSSNRGHILGVNVTTPIPPGLSLEETVDRIHEAGGIAVAAHPSATYKGGIGLDKTIASYGVDAIEVFNSSVCPYFLLTHLSRRLADRAGLPQTAGSDSHLPETIGLAYLTIENVTSEPEIEDVIAAVKEGMTVPFGRPTPWRLRLRKIM